MARNGRQKIRVGAVCYALLVLGGGLIIPSGVAVTAAITALLLMLAAQQGKEEMWLSGRYIQFLGLISYSLYLIHNPLTGATFNIFKRIFPSGPISDVFGIILVALVCVGVGFIAYYLIERPSISLSRRIRLVVAPRPVMPHSR